MANKSVIYSTMECRMQGQTSSKNGIKYNGPLFTDFDIFSTLI